jgi:hypothetical protein
MKFEWFVGIFFALMIAFAAFYYVNLAHVHQTCDGAVVKNVWDWPVCVESGK